MRASWPVPSLTLNSASHCVFAPSASTKLYGDTHDEVGGVFERDGIAGAFGARRDR